MDEQLDRDLFDLFGAETKTSDPAWMDYPLVRMHLNDGTFHADVINHYNKRLNESAVMTDSHETTHMINSDIRNAQGGTTRVNAFYVGDNRAIVLPEPRIRKSHVARYVPRSLQGMRYGTYVTGQTDWDDTPLYLYDEWIAYVNGGRTGVDLVEKGLYRDSSSDGVAGLLEFCVYTTALVQAVAVNDPDYLRQTTDFLPYTNWLLRHAKGIFDKGHVMAPFQFPQQEQYLEAWRTSPDAEDLRKFMKDHLDASWLA